MLDHARSRPPTIAVMGGGGFQMDPDDPRLDDWLLGLTGRRRPRVCLVPTASGDRPALVDAFLSAFGEARCDPSVLRLFNRTADLRSQIMSSDLVYVTGGNTANMLAIWKVHGVIELLREAWGAGVVLAGLSAGSLCWFESGVTDSFGPDLAPIDGLGFLPGSHCPHYDGEARRRPTYHRLLAEGVLPAGLALDDGAAARYVGMPPRRVEVVRSRAGAGAYLVECTDRGPVEQALSVRQLP